MVFRSISIRLRFQRHAARCKRSCKTGANSVAGEAGPRFAGLTAVHFQNPVAGASDMMDQQPAIWIKDPLAILADGAERGIVVKEGRIVELVPKGGRPATAAAAFEAGSHVVLPGLINTHHHFYQTLTRAFPPALDRELFPWLQALYPVWARLTPESLHLGVTVAMSELLLSGCTTTTDHHYVFPAGLEDAVDIEGAVTNRLGGRVLLTRGSMNSL